MVDLPAPFGPAIKVRVGTLRGASTHLANNLIVRAGWSAGNPADLEPSAIGLFHYRKSEIAVDVERRSSGGQRFGERLSPSVGHSLVELGAVELVLRHIFILRLAHGRTIT